MAGRVWVVQQGATLRLVESDEAPDLAVKQGEKTKRLVFGPVDAKTAEKFIKVKVERAGAVRVA